MSTPTTMAAIRAHYCGSASARGVLEQLTPSTMTDRLFTRLMPRTLTMDVLSDQERANSAFLRRYEWRVTDDIDEAEVLHNPMQRIEGVTLAVAYPKLPALYGTDDLDAMEDVIRADARTLRDALLSPGNLPAGCIAVLPTIRAVDRQDVYWFQEIACSVTYFEAQTLV